MDGIQVYATPARPAAHAPTPAAANPSAAKAVSDYIRAVRRRIWLVLAVAVPLAIGLTIWTVRLPPVYLASAQIIIEPPQYDAVLSTLVAPDMGRRDTDATEKYIPDRVALLKSKFLVEQVINDPAFLPGAAAPDEDSLQEFLKNLSTKMHLGSHWVTVGLEGDDPARTAKQLYILLDVFKKRCLADAQRVNDDIAEAAGRNADALKRDLDKLHKQIVGTLQTSKTIGPGGKNIIQSQYETLGVLILQKHSRLDDFNHQSSLAQLFPKVSSRPEDAGVAGRISQLQEMRHKLELRLAECRRRVRESNFNFNPTAKSLAGQLESVLDQLDRLENIPKEAAMDPSESILASMRDEIRSLEQAGDALQEKFQASLPEYENYLRRSEEYELKQKQLFELQTKVQSFDMLAQSQAQKSPVWIPPSVAEPTQPIRPRRVLYVAGSIVMSLGLGIALVCMLEHLDHSVKVPEHLSQGLTLPLLGVVPRIRRTALVDRGGHLWTQGAPASVEADAYRNLRASLLGASDRLGPIVTLLVTSAKAGEGKSTTALNLAATCARAGERTLLVDADLRRPSLAGAFEHDPEANGLTDVLRGTLPWQRTLVRTEIPNLDFLPTGDTRDVPVEILGTLELRQLLIALSSHYDRVILDGPAILGLADCRVLGRVVDAAVLVVRSGSHELRPLLRAKSMLEQSHVVLAGVIFNGLYEDFQNWSSYGLDSTYGAIAIDARSFERVPRLDAPDEEAASLKMSTANA